MANYDAGVTYDSGIFYDAVVPATPNKRMAKVKLNLQHKSDTELVQFNQQHITAMTGNANFPTPNPPAAAFATLATTFENAVNAVVAGQQTQLQLTATKETARVAVEAALRQREGDVDTTSAGDEAKILSSGFQVREPAQPVGPLPAPLDFLATMGDLEGHIDLAWSRVRGAKTYLVQMSPYATPRNWTQACIAVKSTCHVEDLTPGQTYVFRIAAIGTAGQGPWSDESVKMAP